MIEFLEIELLVRIKEGSDDRGLDFIFQ
jgi:hypothetical protein